MLAIFSLSPLVVALFAEALLALCTFNWYSHRQDKLGDLDLGDIDQGDWDGGNWK
ncbi:MAG: hypothetical protein RLY14_1063 [Planctomycetota bacterium]|jgi:hypothetical protein